MTVHTALNLGCWTQINGVRGKRGTAYEIGHLEQCQQLCIHKLKCVAINFSTTRRWKMCRILTTTATGPLLPALKKILQYYRLDRDCIRLPRNTPPVSIWTTHTALNLGCWSQVNGVRGRGGVVYKFGHLEQCRQMCIRKRECVAINFATTRRWNMCRILTTTASEPLSPELKNIVQYYRLDRDCIRLPSTLQWRSHDFILGV